jgi:alanyl-tRNA synthetase
MQYEDQLGRVRSNLPTPAIDTGMGLERMAAVLQGKNNNFDTDLFQTLIASAATVTNCYEIGKSHRVIADHIRAIGFLIADGIMPSNEGRGYVLRRIMRRAMRHAYHLGLRDPGLFKIIPVLVSEMSDAYPELSRAHGTMSTILQLEEERFIKTLDHGMKLLTEESASISSGGKLAGDIAFKLYDTYGFPIDLTSDALSAKGISVDTDSFDACMQKQKQMARAAWNGSGETAQQQLWLDLAATKDATDFIGYLHEKATALITAIVQDGKSINEASSGDCIVLLNQTPFYAESGGQVGDVGTLTNSTGTSIVVADTKKYAAVLHGHHVKIPHGITLKVGDAVTAAIDASTRQDTKCNHSATHLLHNALRSTLGEHVVQKGSWVGPQRLRFDFAHTKALSADEINMVEKIVNKMVITNLPTGTVVMSFDEAVASGAIALFGEKYTSDVRVISMGESMELCGGTHVKNTGAIGLFKIVSEESVSFGIRRIEAVTGMSAIHFVNDYQQKVHQICATAKCQPATAVHKVESLVNEVRQLQKTCAEQRVALALHHPLESMSYGDIHLYMLRIGELDASESKMLIAELQQRCGDNSVVMLTIAMESKSTIMLSIGKQLVGRVDAREIARRVAAASGGGGGGRPELAQVGGVDSNKLSGALSALEEYIKEC